MMAYGLYIATIRKVKGADFCEIVMHYFAIVVEYFQIVVEY